MRRLMATLIGLGLTAVQASGQAPAPRPSIGPNTRVVPGEHNEPWLAASSTNPRVLVAVGHVGASISVDKVTVATLVSRDGGRSWAPARLPGAGLGGFDPMVAAGPEGRLYVMQGQQDLEYATLVASGSTPRDARPKGSIKVWSAQGDAWTWEGPAVLESPVQPDHARLVVDLSRGPHRGRVYIAWNDWWDMFVPDQYEVFLQYSDDGGKTFTERQLIDSKPAGKLVATEPVVLSDGTLLVTYYQYWNPLADKRNLRMPFFVRRSTDGGRTFGPVETAFELGPHVWLDRVPEFNQAFSLPTVVADSSGTSPYRDHVYVTWDDTHQGESNIWLVRSTDQGRTWSRPIRVNDNRATGLDVKDFRMTPTVAVSHHGVVAVSWYDRRNDPTRQCWEYFIALSTDGGATFGPNRAISTAPSCPPATLAPSVFISNLSASTDPNQPPDSVLPRLSMIERLGAKTAVANRAARQEAATAAAIANGRINVSFDPARNVWPGHYSGLAADVDGVFHALWLDRRNGAMELYTARIVLNEAARPPSLVERDVTDRVEIVAGLATFDRAKGVVQFPLQVRNVSGDPIHGPITVGIVGVKQTAGQPSATLVDSALARGRAPHLTFDGKLGSENVLRPLDLSEPIIVTLETQAATGWDAVLEFRVIGLMAR